MSDIQLEFEENEAGLNILRDEIDKTSGQSTIFHNPEYDSPRNWVPMGKGVRGRPKQNYIVVKQDLYRDEMQCKKCSGKGHGVIECRTCGGRKGFSAKGNWMDCPDCRCSDFDSPAFPRSSGFYSCSDCKGTGQAVAGKTGIVTSTDNAKHPSTGVIVGVGKLVKEWRLGQRILFSMFAGVAYECENRIFRVMMETYPIMEIVGDGDVQTREGI